MVTTLTEQGEMVGMWQVAAALAPLEIRPAGMWQAKMASKAPKAEMVELAAEERCTG